VDAFQHFHVARTWPYTTITSIISWGPPSTFPILNSTTPQSNLWTTPTTLVQRHQMSSSVAEGLCVDPHSVAAGHGDRFCSIAFFGSHQQELSILAGCCGSHELFIFLLWLINRKLMTSKTGVDKFIFKITKTCFSQNSIQSCKFLKHALKNSDVSAWYQMKFVGVKLKQLLEE